MRRVQLESRGKSAPLQRREHACRRQRELPHSNACGIEERVTNGACRGRHHFFASAGLLLIQPLHHHRRDLGAFFEAQDRVATPIKAGDVGRIQSYFLME